MNLSPLPIQKFFDQDGRPLSGGKLFSYVAGSATKIATYTDAGGALNTNPIILDFRGECRLWIDPDLSYKFTLAPANDTDPPGNPIWTVDNITMRMPVEDNTATDTGGANAIALAITGLPTTPVTFTRIVFKAAATNTGPTTISINGGPTKSLTWRNLAAISAAAILQNGVYEAIYDGTQWQLQAPSLQPPQIRTTAEIAAGVTPSNYCYDELNVRRYGAIGDNVTNDTTAIQNAILVGQQIVATYAIGATVYLPKGVYKTTAKISLTTGVSIAGDGYLASVIKPSGAIIGMEYSPSSYSESGITLSDFSIYGDAGSTLTLLNLANGTKMHLVGVRLRDTADACIKIGIGVGSIGFLGLSLERCQLESFASYGIQISSALGSVLSARDIQVNANAVTGIAFLGTTGTGSATNVTLENVNVNGNVTKLANMIRVNDGGALSELGMRECYAEFMSGSVIVALGTGTMTQCEFARSNISGANSIQIDLTNGQPHSGIIIDQVRAPTAVGALFSPGSTTDFMAYMLSTDGSAPVASFGTATNVSKAAGTAAHANLNGSYTGTLTGCTTAPTGTVKYISYNGSVTLTIPTLTATSNTTACTITGMPTSIRPSVNQICIARYTDNGVTAVGLVVVDTAGVITFFNGATSSTFFTAAGTKGCPGVTIPYSLD